MGETILVIIRGVLKKSTRALWEKQKLMFLITWQHKRISGVIYPNNGPSCGNGGEITESKNNRVSIVEQFTTDSNYQERWSSYT